MLKKFLLLSSALVLAAAPFAKADTIGTVATFSLTADGCSGGCGAGPYGTITLTQSATGVVTVNETLASGVAFVGTGAGVSLEFNLTGSPAVTIGNITNPFFSNGPDTASTFGNFNYSVTCWNKSAKTGCGPGGSNPNPGPLSFTVTNGTGVNVSDFVANSGGYFFSSDVLGVTGNTGNVAAKGGTTTIPTVPEPSSLLLFGTGVLSAAGLIRRKLF